MRRCLAAVPVVFGVTLIVFLLIQLVPGDAARSILGPKATPDALIALRKELGLDEPLPIQYLKWLSRLVQGDLGKSLELRVPVTGLILARLQNTLILGVAALTLSTTVGLIVGVISAVRPHSLFDRIGMVMALFGNSMPAFWIGMLLLLTFSLHFRWFPVGGMYSARATEKTLLDLGHHLVLPAISLGSLAVATVARMTRSCMLEVLRANYVRTARAKGLSEYRVVLVHALRNALLPVVTVVGLQFGIMLGGAVLTETVFSWPGLGRQLFNAISARDLPLTQGSMLVLAIGFVLINLVVDILYAYLNPRIRLIDQEGL